MSVTRRSLRAGSASGPRKEFGSAWRTRHRMVPRNTPHSTIFRRKIQRHSPMESQGGKRKRVKFEEVEAICNEMLGKTWVCFRCYPLFQFHTDSTSLKRYAQNLSAFVAAEVKKNSVMSTDESVSDITANIEIVKGLAMSQGEPDAIKISLKDVKEKIIGQMVLCSIGITDEMDGAFTSAPVYLKKQGKRTRRHPRRMDFLTLPLLLCHGLVRPRNAVIAWLQENFDCNIKLMQFNPIELTWMISMWTSIPYQPMKKENKCFFTEFTWKIPMEGLGVDKIEYQMDLQSVKTIWDSIHRDNADEITLEHVEKFKGAIVAHLTYIFHIKFEALSLIQIAAPFVQVHKDGKMKLCSSKYVHTVLTHLSCIAAERLTRCRGLRLPASY